MKNSKKSLDNSDALPLYQMADNKNGKRRLHLLFGEVRLISGSEIKVLRQREYLQVHNTNYTKIV